MAYKEKFYNQNGFFNFDRNLQQGSAKLPVFLIAGLVIILVVVLLLLPNNRNNSGETVKNIESLETTPAPKGELVSGFPTELMLYDNAEITGGEDATFEGVNQKIAVFTVPDAPAEVSGYYIENLPIIEWKLISENTNEEFIELVFAKENRFEVLITSHINGSQVRINLISEVK